MASPMWSTAKEDLVVLCAKMAGRLMAPDDICYKVMRWPQGYQATVTLECLDGAEYAGDLCDDAEDAEKAAARQALLAYPSEVEQLRQLSELGPAGPAAVPEPADPKGDLEMLCAQRKGTVLVPSDIVYEVNKWPQGFQATVTIGLTGARYAGDLCPTGDEAEKAAAQQAVLAMAEENKQEMQMHQEPQLALNGTVDDTPKFELAGMCVKASGRRMVKDDILYKAIKWEQGYQATVTLNCLTGASYAGELCTSIEESEVAAARQAMLAIGDDPEATAAAVAGMANAANAAAAGMLMASMANKEAEAAAAAENAYAEMLQGGLSWQEIAAHMAGGTATAQTDAAAAILAAAATGNATGLVNGAGGVDVAAFLASQGVTDINAYMASLTGIEAAAAAGMAMAVVDNAAAMAAASKMMPDLGRSMGSSRGHPDGQRPPKKPKNEMPCRFFMKGFQPGFTPGPQHCRNGDQCAFSHDADLIQKALADGPLEPLQKNSHIACKFHMAGPGRCIKGEECNFSHDPEVIANAIATGDVVPYIPRERMGPPPKLILKAEVCKYYMNGICRSGIECPYAHGIEDFRGDLNAENYQLLVSLRQASPPMDRVEPTAAAKALEPKAKARGGRAGIPAAFKTQAFRRQLEEDGPQESSSFQQFDSFEPTSGRS